MPDAYLKRHMPVSEVFFNSETDVQNIRDNELKKTKEGLDLTIRLNIWKCPLVEWDNCMITFTVFPTPHLV